MQLLPFFPQKFLENKLLYFFRNSSLSLKCTTKLPMYAWAIKSILIREFTFRATITSSKSVFGLYTTFYIWRRKSWINTKISSCRSWHYLLRLGSICQFWKKKNIQLQIQKEKLMPFIIEPQWCWFWPWLFWSQVQIGYPMVDS